MRKTFRQEITKIDNFDTRSHGGKTWHDKEHVQTNLIIDRHPERSEAESKDPLALSFVVPGDSSTSLGMTARFYFFRRSCLRISDTITPWILSSRAGTRSG